MLEPTSNFRKGIACQVSPVFKKAFTGNFIEGQTLTYDLSDIEPRTFVLLVKWIYNRDIGFDFVDAVSRIKTGMEPEHHAAMQAVMDNEDMEMVRLWVLADRLRIGRLQNIAMKNLSRRRELYTWEAGSRRRSSVLRPSTHWIPYAYDNTLSHATLQQFARDQVRFFIDQKILDDNPEHFPPQLYVDIVRRLLTNSVIHKSDVGPVTFSTKFDARMYMPNMAEYLVSERLEH